MCTVLFTPLRRGYLLGMNRDEQRTRVTAQSPRHRAIDGRKTIFPSEPGGGTWVGVNDAGVSLALVNWYAVAAEVRDPPVTRGRVVRETLSADNADAVEARLRELPLDRLRPFRLIGVFPGEAMVNVWSWDHQQLNQLRHPWRPGIWASSGHDERGAQAIRTRVFRQALRQPDAGSPAWLRRLLGSHLPTAGAHSICMHRTDAATVSRTEIQVSDRRARLEYWNGSPCRKSSGTTRDELPLIVRAPVSPTSNTHLNKIVDHPEGNRPCRPLHNSPTHDEAEIHSKSR